MLLHYRVRALSVLSSGTIVDDRFSNPKPSKLRELLAHCSHSSSPFDTKMNSADVQDAVANEVNDRLAKATADLQEKYARGQGGVEESVSAPTGSAYKELHAQEQREKAQKKANSRAQSQKNQVAASEMEVGEDEEDGIDDNEDYELRQIKEARLRQLKNAHKAKLDNLGKGHGQFREIMQDEFIAQVTSSDVVICNFFHRDFPRCTIMDHHLTKLASRHIETKFIKIDAEKAPFFVEKLVVRTMPTVVVFHDGVAVDKIIGFEGLADSMPEGQEDAWPTVVLARLLAVKGGINNASIVDDDEVEANMKAQMMEIRRKQAMVGMQNFDDLDDDLDD